MPILSAHQLSITRGERVLFKDLSFSLNAGTALHLRGRNGAGKTSLLEVLCGLRRLATGEVKAPQPQQMHWLGHRNALNPALSAQENLAFWCNLNHVNEAGITPALTRLGLAKLCHRACRTLSAGQKRRSALARLLLAKRDLWLLDEPLDGLDSEGLSLFAAMLSEHLQRGGAAVVTSHQPLPAGLPQVQALELA